MMEGNMVGILTKLWISITAVTVFTAFGIPVLYFLLAKTSYWILRKAEYANEHVKSANKFIKSLCWMALVLLCSLGLLIFTSLLRLLQKIDVFRTLGDDEEECT